MTSVLTTREGDALEGAFNRRRYLAIVVFQNVQRVVAIGTDEAMTPSEARRVAFKRGQRMHLDTPITKAYGDVVSVSVMDDTDENRYILGIDGMLEYPPSRYEHLPPMYSDDPKDGANMRPTRQAA